MAQSTGVTGPRRLLTRLRAVMREPRSGQDKLNQVVRLIAADMVAEVCSCYLTRAGEVLELFATEGLKPEAVHRTRLGYGEGLVGTIAVTAQPLTLSDAQSHPAFAYRPETGEEIYQSLMGVPISHGGKVIGVLVVQNKTRRHYDEEEVEALEIVAMVLAELAAGGELVNPHELSGPEGAVTRTQMLDGMPLVGGLGMGTVVIHRPSVHIIDVVAEDPGRERARLFQAAQRMQADVDRKLDAPDMVGSGAHRDVLETYRMFARDSGWLARITEAIASGLTAEAAVSHVQADMRARMSKVPSALFRERLHDLDDLANRLLHYLSGTNEQRVPVPQEGEFIVVARSMGPAEFLDYDRDRLRGLILEEGSPTMHVTIMARAFSVPVVGRVRDALQRISADETAIVDGVRGEVVVQPGDDLIDHYREETVARAARRATYERLRDSPARTLDGTDISLNINVGLEVDVDHLDATGAEGVGLFRTEIPFMISARFPDVPSQTELYRRILTKADNRPVVFRTLDIGGDKRLPYLPQMEEDNPALGWRAIRIGLDRPQILRNQLRALIRAAGDGALRVMFPMVSDVSELVAARAMLDHALDQARAGGEPVPAAVHVGVMLEVPALLWQLDDLLPQIAFLSVGTNDLMQFLYASDRGNPRMAGRYDILSPAMLALVEGLVAQCARHQVELAVCGEAAGETVQALGLIGVGVRRLSMPPSRIGAVKLMIRSLRLGELEAYLAVIRRWQVASLRVPLGNFARDHGISI